MKENNNYDSIPNRKEMIKELKKSLDQACKAYYNSNQLVMTDEEFDQNCILYKKLTGKTYSTLTAPNKSNKLIQIEHSFENLQGTIDNKFPNLNDFNEWLKSMFQENNINLNDTIQLLITLKYDGNSICIEYENGKTKLALTRGDDKGGIDLTNVFKNKTIKKNNYYIGIKYECIMTYDNYDKLNQLKEKNNDNIYANPRSTVSGLLGRNDASDYLDYLTLVPLSIRIKDKNISRNKELELLDKIIKDKEVELTGNIISGNYEFLINKIKEIYDKYTTERFNLNFMIDGLVVEFLDSKIRKKLGYFASGSPKFTCALKFPYQEKETVVEDIVFEASPNGTGKITPSVIYKPIYFNGAKQNKTSLANYKRFKELKLGKGSKIIVQYRNDCLSYVNPIDCEENKHIKPIPFTTNCPICDSKLVIHKNDKGEETFIYCKNEKCKMKIIGKINNYTNAVGIKGIEIQTLEKLYNAKLIESPVDLYNLSFRNVSKLDGMGIQSATNLIDAIKSATPNDYDILSGLGIQNLGPDMAKIILSEFSFDYLCDKKFIKSKEFKNRLEELNGVGPIMSERIINEFSSDKINNLLNELLLKVKFKSTKRVKAENQLIFVATGDPNKEIFNSRTDMKDYIESHGHKMTSSVSTKTNYLVTENPNSGTVKNKKAKELGIKIITSEELKELLG